MRRNNSDSLSAPDKEENQAVGSEKDVRLE